MGTIFRQLASFIMLPVYTHFMTPSDYGVIGLLIFTLALMEPFFGARLTEAIPKFYYEEDSDKYRKAVLGSALTVTGLISAITSCIIFLTRESASSALFGTNSYALAVGLFGFQIVTQALEYYGLTFIRLQQRPTLYVLTSFSKLILQLALNIWLIAYMKLGVMGVVISGGVSSALYALLLTGYIIHHAGYRFELSVARRMLLFSWPLWFAGLASLYIFQSNRYLIRTFGSLDQVGLYELAAKFSGILAMLVWNPFSQIWEMERFSYYRQANATEIFEIVFRIISTVLIVVGLGISIFAQPIIRIMSAPSFHSAAQLVSFLTLGAVFSSLTTFVNFSFLVSERTHQISQNNYITVIFITLFNLLLIPRVGDVGAAIALMLALCLQFILAQRAARKCYDMQVRPQALIPMITIATLGYIAANYAAVILNIWLDVLIKSAIYCVSAFAIAYNLWRNPKSRPFIISFATAVLRKNKQ
jgi:O-antigen/teichoic acid export membrane protein